MQFILLLSVLLPLSLAANIAPALVGTWSTGNGAVLTGPHEAKTTGDTVLGSLCLLAQGVTSSDCIHASNGFADPVNNSFTYPAVAGIAFSFTNTGYFEQSEFRWVSNATEPHCVKAVVSWLHGTYQVNANGSITTDSRVFPGDGRIQVQDACAATTSIITYYDQPGLYASYSTSPWRGKTMLQMQAFDGSLMPRLYQVTKDPTKYMYPTSSLTNVTNTLNKR